MASLEIAWPHTSLTGGLASAQTTVITAYDIIHNYNTIDTTFVTLTLNFFFFDNFFNKQLFFVYFVLPDDCCLRMGQVKTE